MASVDVLFTGYVGERVAGTVGLVRAGDVTAILDPGMVPDRSVILDPLVELGVEPAAVTDVIISHHHPDHTMNVALFPGARLHDNWAIYHRDVWTSRPAEGARLADSVWLMETPGHTPQDITTLVETRTGIVAFTHLWWNEQAATDPLAWDPQQLEESRTRVLDVATTIIPGHGAPFAATGAPK